MFEDGDIYKGDPEGCNDIERYLFVHTLFGAREVIMFCQILVFHNYKLVSGKDILFGYRGPILARDRFLKKQIALEFLLRFYIFDHQ
jgi:hypothetical protein